MAQTSIFEAASRSNPYSVLLRLPRDARGHIVTCYHVVKGLAEVKVSVGPVVLPPAEVKEIGAIGSHALFFRYQSIALPLFPLQVTLHDLSTYTAKIVGWDAAKDIAVLRLSR